MFAQFQDCIVILLIVQVVRVVFVLFTISTFIAVWIHIENYSEKMKCSQTFIKLSSKLSSSDFTVVSRSSFQKGNWSWNGSFSIIRGLSSMFSMRLSSFSMGNHSISNSFCGFPSVAKDVHRSISRLLFQKGN